MWISKKSYVKENEGLKIYCLELSEWCGEVIQSGIFRDLVATVTAEITEQRKSRCLRKLSHENVSSFSGNVSRKQIREV